MSYITRCNVGGTNTWNLLANAPTTNWSGITCTSDGKTVYACAGNASTSGYIYTSTNYGINWTTITGASNTWSNIICNSNGNFGAAIASGTTQIYITTNWGTSWTPYASSLNWSGITINATGQYMNACVNGGLIYTATTFGNTWASTTTGNQAWTGIASDITGQNIVACVNGGNIWISTNYGISGSFSTTGPPSLQSWSCIAMNTTGQYMAAGTSTVGGNIWVSPTGGFGNIWFSNFSSPYSSWQNVSVSSTGQYMAATEQTGNIYLSTNYGQSWLQQTSYTNTWTALCMNYSGQYMYAGSNQNIYGFSQTLAFEQIFKTVQSQSVTITTGFNISGSAPNVYTTPSPSRIWNNVDCNSTGSLILATSNTVGSRGVWRSIDYGLTWNNVFITTLSYPNGRCSYTTGQYCCCISGNIFISSTFGVSWNDTNFASNNSAQCMMAISDDGSVLYNGFGNLSNITLNISRNYGLSWNQTTLSGGPYSIRTLSMSGTGQYIQFGADYVGGTSYLFISTNYGTSYQTPSGILQSGQPVYITLCSRLGQYIYLITGGTGGGKVWRSSDYGSTWNNISTVSTSWRSAAVSATGQYILGPGSISSDYGNTWNSISINSNIYHSLAITGSGMFCIAGSSAAAYITTYTQNSDLAKSFEPINTASNILVPASTPGFNYTLQKIRKSPNPGQNIYSVCNSASGQYILVALSYASNGASVSSNYGTTFTNITNISGINGSTDTVEMSSSGQYMYVVHGGTSKDLFISNNYGVNFTTVSTGLFVISGGPIKTSSTGQYTIVSFYRSTTNLYTIFISTNYGASFIQKSLSDSQGVRCVCVNYSGQYYGAVMGYQQGLYISSNSGASFTFLQLTFIPVSISCSNTGQYFVLSDSGSNNIYISNNYGKSFYQSSSPSILWSSIYISSSGQTIVGMSMTSGDNNIYISKNYGLTWNNIPVSGSLPISNRYQFSSDNNITSLVYVDISSYVYLINLSQTLDSLFQSI